MHALTDGVSPEGTQSPLSACIMCAKAVGQQPQSAGIRGFPLDGPRGGGDNVTTEAKSELEHTKYEISGE